MKNMKIFNPSIKNKGFTLIELSIVLVIIGLLTGGVLVGRELIKAAQLRSFIKQYANFETAVMTFRGKYNGIPGDITLEQAAMFGFAPTTRDPSFAAGYVTHGNGIIEDGDGMPPLHIVHGFDFEGTQGGARLDSEGLFFWEDLSSAHLIEGTFNSYTTAAETPIGPLSAGQINLYLPQAKAGKNASWAIIDSYYVIATITAPVDSHLQLFPAFTPIEAYGIDQKIDDGIPASGIVWASNPTNWSTPLINIVAGNNCYIAGNPSYYDTAANPNNPACNLVIKASF